MSDTRDLLWNLEQFRVENDRLNAELACLKAENERLRQEIAISVGDVHVRDARIAELKAALRAIRRRVTLTGDPEVDCDFDERAAILAVQKIAAAALKGETDEQG